MSEKEQVSEETQTQEQAPVEQSRFSEKGSLIYEEIIKQAPNMHDMITIMHLSISTIITSLYDANDETDAQTLCDQMRIEVNNSLVEIETTISTNEKISEYVKDKDFSFRYVPLTDMIEYVTKDGTILYINSSTHQVKTNSTDMNEETVSEAFKNIKEVTDMILEKNKEALEAQKENVVEEPVEEPVQDQTTDN